MKGIKTNWYVLTGGPCSGKTVCLEYLASLGYFTFPEISRVLIDLGMAKGQKPKEIRKNELKFQRETLKIKLKLESKLDPKKIIFFDRGIPDSIAYFRNIGSDTKKAFEESKKIIYKKVFFLEQFHFKDDYARTENKRTAEKISNLIFEAYSEVGYKLIRVPPKKTIEEKARFILKRL